MPRNRLPKYATLTLVLAMPAFALGAGNNLKLYAALDAGQSTLDGDAFANDVDSSDDRANAFSVRFGYRFNRYFSLEAGYADLGEYSATLEPATASVSLDGFLVNALGTWPAAPHFQLNASIGAIYRHAEVTTRTTAGTATHLSDSDGVIRYGLGIGIPINDRFEIALDVTRVGDTVLPVNWNPVKPELISSGNATMTSLGMRWRF